MTSEALAHTESSPKQAADHQSDPLEPWDLPEFFVKSVPISYARRFNMALRQAGDREYILESSDPIPDQVIECMNRMLPIVYRTRSHEGDPQSSDVINAVINSGYQRWGGVETQTALRGQAADPALGIESIDDLLDDESQAPTIRIVNAVVLEAVRLNASDIHFDPSSEKLVVRMRIDGVLEDRHVVPNAIKSEIVSRIKVMARMNVAEKRIPQDGRVSVEIGGQVLDLRIATLPNVYGERVVIRLLDSKTALRSLEDLGMQRAVRDRFTQLIRRPNGIILVTGPTGSGKTTTLYAALQLLNHPDRNIITIEDPVEYRISGISQTQINEKAGMTFAGGVRSVLRQDPDVMMIGEIRDHDTAVMAMQASMTGHLVLSTLHTNDAPSSVVRLLDLGVESFMLSSSLSGVLAQRLVRCVCPHCGERVEATHDERAWLGVEEQVQIVHASGCNACRRTGYVGRAGLYELLVVDESMREAISSGAGIQKLRQEALRTGMVDLRSAGCELIIDGRTTIEEVQRVSQDAQG